MRLGFFTFRDRPDADVPPRLRERRARGLDGSIHTSNVTRSCTTFNATIV
jgi:hypothetical protein